MIERKPDAGRITARLDALKSADWMGPARRWWPNYDSLGMHMPVPIFFLFDAKDILTRKTTRFSTGNLSQDPLVGNDALFFESIPFEKVYHDSWMSGDEKWEIKFHRHAEVIVPHELELDSVRRDLVQIGGGIPNIAAPSSVAIGKTVQGANRPRKTTEPAFLQMDFC